MGKQSPSIEICVSVIMVVVLLMREGMPMIILLGMSHCQKKQRFLAEYIRFLSILFLPTFYATLGCLQGLNSFVSKPMRVKG